MFGVVATPPSGSVDRKLIDPGTPVGFRHRRAAPEQSLPSRIARSPGHNRDRPAAAPPRPGSIQSTGVEVTEKFDVAAVLRRANVLAREMGSLGSRFAGDDSGCGSSRSTS